MSKLGRVVDGDGHLYGYHFYCPGCKDLHTVGASWTFNGSMDAPTFQPSVLVTYPGDQGKRCHSFIKDGWMQFLNDCTHWAAGKTVPMEEWTGLQHRAMRHVDGTQDDD